jgi:6-phosphogluconolactonase
MSITGPGLGTGTNRIVTFSIDANSGALTQVPQATFIPSQPFSAERMVISPNGKFLLATADIGTGSGFAAPTQGVRPISRDPNTGVLSSTLVPIATISGDDNFDGLAVTPANSFLVGADTGSNLIFVWSIDQNTGALTQVAQFGQALSTTVVAPMGVAIDPSGKFVIVANSQSSNVSVFSISSAGMLTPVAGSPFKAGSGPTGVAINASGTLVFVGNAQSNDLSVFQLDANSGNLTPVQGTPLPLGTSAFNLMTVVAVN